MTIHADSCDLRYLVGHGMSVRGVAGDGDELLSRRALDGYAIVDDRPEFQRGVRFTMYDGKRTISGLILKRRRLRDGSVKLWLTAVEIDG